jgi:hypothetical protein
MRTRDRKKRQSPTAEHIKQQSLTMTFGYDDVARVASIGLSAERKTADA